MGVIIVVLIICALIAVIFGKEVAKKLLGCFLIVGFICILPIIYFSCKAYKEMGTPGSNNTNTNTVTGNYNPAPVTESYLGIKWEPMNSTNEQLYNVPQGSGIYISQVESGSPAALVGLKVGDFIIKADNTWINSSWTIDDAKFAHPKGEAILLTVIHDGKLYNVNILPIRSF